MKVTYNQCRPLSNSAYNMTNHDVSDYHITPIPAFQDNYIWMIVHPQQKAAYLIDPGCAKSAQAALIQHQVTLVGILVTHHHPDHIGGIQQLVSHYQCPVYGPSQEVIPCRSHAVQQGDQIQIFGHLWSVIDVPGHTGGHIAFYHACAYVPRLWCGDTLFSVGCGRLFDPTANAEQLYHSLQTIAQLPKNTQVYCTHEYTLANLRFARHVDPNNAQLIQYQQQVAKLRANQQPSLPTLLKNELEMNPFLRCHLPEIQAQISRHSGQTYTDTCAYFVALRQWKDSF